jgi:hypothetical protein
MAMIHFNSSGVIGRGCLLAQDGRRLVKLAQAAIKDRIILPFHQHKERNLQNGQLFDLKNGLNLQQTTKATKVLLFHKTPSKSTNRNSCVAF